jgi:hypothetical protein
MAYVRKTKDVYLIIGNYGYGWEEVTEEETRKAAVKQLRCYNENEPQYPHIIISRRVKI